MINKRVHRFSRSRRTLGFAALLVFVSSVAVQVGAMPELTFKGKARLRYEDTQQYNVAAFERNQFWSVRVRPSVLAKVDDHVSIFVEPQFAKRLGADTTAATDASGTTTPADHFHMHQGHLILTVAEGFVLKGGRLALSYGDQFIVGPADWGTYGRAFDGAMLSWKNDLVTVDLSQLKEISTVGVVGGDKDTWILYSSWKLAEALKAVDVYALYESGRPTAASTATSDSRNAIGARVKAKFSDVDLGAEYVTQKGSRAYIGNDDATNMIFAEAGYTFTDLAKLRVGFEYDSANEYWAEWYPTTKSTLGRNDVVGRRNLTAYAVRLSAEPDTNLKVTLDYWMFSRTSDSATAFRTDSTTAVGTTAGSTAKDIGSSIEASAAYKATENLEYGLGVAYFMKGAYLKDNATIGDSSLMDFYLMANVSF